MKAYIINLAIDATGAEATVVFHGVTKSPGWASNSDTEDGKGRKSIGSRDESAAEKAGIKEGDIYLTSFDGKKSE